MSSLALEENKEAPQAKQERGTPEETSRGTETAPKTTMNPNPSLFTAKTSHTELVDTGIMML